jgi:hypothetical protein
MYARAVVAALVVAVSSGCASGGGASSGTASRSSRSQDVIAEAEIASRARDATNALQIVEQLRPQMLRSRGATSLAPNTSSDDMLPRVYVDDVSYGTIGTLSNITALQIKEIRFVNSQNATTRWGTGHTGGVILVTTKK